MVRHIYLMTGEVDDISVMKVGISNFPKDRQKALGLSLDWYCDEYLTDAAAFQLERRAQNYLLSRGAQQFNHSNDWFLLDTELLERVKFFLIRQLSTSWFDVIRERDRRVAGLTAELYAGYAERERLLREIGQLREEKATALSRLEAKIELYEEGRLKPLKKSRNSNAG